MSKNPRKTYKSKQKSRKTIENFKIPKKSNIKSGKMKIQINSEKFSEKFLKNSEKLKFFLKRAQKYQKVPKIKTPKN